MKGINNVLLEEFSKSIYKESSCTWVKNDEDIRDFSDFPDIPCVKKTNMKPLHFNDVAGIAYYSEDDLPEGIRYIEELNNRYVVYMILLKTNGGMPYFGSTGDFGERLLTHLKDGRSCDRQLYELLRTENKCIVKILGVFKTEEEAKEVEKYYIESYRQLIGAYICNQSIYNFKEMKIREIIKPYMLNITNVTK